MLEKQYNIAETIAVERAIDELRRQQGVAVRNASGQAAGYFPAEFITEAQWHNFRNATPRLLLSAPRARLLGLGHEAAALDAASLNPAQLHALADPTAPQAPQPALAPIPASETDVMALKLAKYASLLPAMLRLESPQGWLPLDASALAHYIAHPQVEVLQTAAAMLPLEDAENTRIASFRSAHATAVHLALIIGEPEKQQVPLTRIHSACVTGDILGSLRCDCGSQLNLAIRQISAEGGGLLIYLHQEGRGIGITNKLRAYALQERGMDTFDANLALGFEEDERNFAIAAAILKKLGFASIRMLTNNPHKLAAIEAAGIIVKERVPLVTGSGRHNHSYLEAKAKKSGHFL